jgi:PAS domain S-box-containing protein
MAAEAPTTVLLIDDAPDLRALVRIALERSGEFRIAGEGGSGREAIELAAEYRPDLVMLDVSMPDMDGLEALPEVARASPHSRVVVFSGFDAAGLEQRARDLGAVDFIEKSLAINEIPNRLRAAAGRGAAASVTKAPTTDETASADAVLGEHLERFRAAFDGASIGMAALTLTGRIVRANTTLVEILGAPANQLVGVALTDYVHADARKRVAAALQRAIAEPRAVSIEHRLAGDESGALIRSTVSAVRDAHGRSLYLFLQALDITAEVETSRRLHETEQRLHMFIDSVSDYAIFMLDASGNIATWNTGAQRLKGYTADEIIGEHFRIFYTADAQARKHPEHELELAARDGRYEEEGWRVRKDGTRFWANVVITAVYNDSGELAGFGKVTRDNTERHEISEERERVSRTLAAANARLQKAADEKAEFVAITAHELRGPVLLMRGSAETLLDDWDRLDDPTRKRLLELVAGGGDRLHRLLEDLLIVTRAEAGRLNLDMEALHVRPMLEEAVREIDTRGVVAIECEASLAVEADRVRFMQIVTNLVGNAMKYGAPPIELKATTVAGTYVEIAVIDHGVGVPEKDVPRLFNKFATVRRSAQGTGLGLYIVSQLALAQGGWVEYRRARDGGACFVVRLRSPTRRPLGPTVNPERRGVAAVARSSDAN